MNTFLELKVENARLQERLQALRVRSQELSTAQITRGTVPLTFSSGSMSAQLAANLGLDSAPDLTHSSYYGNGMSGHGHGYGAGGGGGSYMGQAEEDAEERRAAKKVSWLCCPCF